MITVIETLSNLGEASAWPIFFVGLVLVLLYNWRLWQQDKDRLATWKQIPPRLPLERWPDLPLVSVLVAAWNEADFIQQHIESFLNLRYPNKELVLVAGGEDGTYNLASKYEGKKVKVFKQLPGEGKQSSLAKGFRETSGELIFLTDADCFLEDSPFECTLYPIAAGEELVCTGGSKPFPTLLEYPLVMVQAASDFYTYSNPNAPSYLPGLLGRNCALKRDLLEQTKAFDVPALTGTDYVLAKTLDQSGYQICQVRVSQITTDYPRSIEGYIRQKRRWLRNVAWFGWQFEAWSEVMASLQTSLIGVIMLSLPLFGFWLGKMPVLLWVFVLFHGYLSRFRYLYLLTKQYDLPAQRLPYKYQLISLISLLADFAAWSLTLSDYFSSRRRQIW